MTKLLYCWRCKMEIPMLEEHEWEQVHPRLQEAARGMKELRLTTGRSLLEAKDPNYGQGALDRYFELTGFRETNINALWHHRVSLFGPACEACGKPLRTPQAKFCPECGTPRF